MSERQTLSYLQQRFRTARIQPQTKFGQNFLIDLNLVRLIAETAELGPRDVVLEVGTGMGSLTTLLAAEAGHVVTVEIDSYLAPLARAEFDTLENVTLLEQDALKNKNHLHPVLIETVQQAVARIPGGQTQTGFESTVQRGDTHSCESVENRSVADSHGGNDSKGARDANYRRPAEQGLQRTEHMDASPMSG